MSGDSRYYTLQMSKNVSMQPWHQVAQGFEFQWYFRMLESEELAGKLADSDESEVLNADESRGRFLCSERWHVIT
jgi:hypothetical protein